MADPVGRVIELATEHAITAIGVTVMPASAVDDISPKDPLLRVRPMAAGKTLVEAVGGPIVYLLEEPNRKAVFFGFDLFRSDLPLRVEFPVMMSRALRWLHPADLDQSSLSLQTGQPILLPVEHGVTTAAVRTPSGRSVRAQVTRGVISFTETDEVGVYTVATSRGETKVAVNLFNPDESELQPKPLPSFVEGARPDPTPTPCSSIAKRIAGRS